jgi:DNA (cytosine-5)-methyltransferase 1
MSEIGELFITALVMPMDDKLVKEKERGVKGEGFGRIESWAIAGYDDGYPIIWVSTEIAEYECLKPAGTYKKHFEIFYEKARVCIEVYIKLAKSSGGNADLGLEELLAGVVRSIGSTSKDFIVSLGEFPYNQVVLKT